MKFGNLLAIGLLWPAVLYGGQALAAGDVAKGAKTFKSKCGACHTSKGTKNGVGPFLSGVFGRQAGTADGFKKFKGLKNASWSWDEKSLAGFLENPSKYTKANNKTSSRMSRKIKKMSEREDLIEFLKSLK